MAETNQTTAETYAVRQREVAFLLDCIGHELERHAQRANPATGDWSMVGDLGHVRDGLREALMFLLSASNDPTTVRNIDEHLDAIRRT